MKPQLYAVNLCIIAIIFTLSGVPHQIPGTVSSLSTDNAWVDSVSEPFEVIITPQLVVS
jgi:hypothetical protein